MSTSPTSLAGLGDAPCPRRRPRQRRGVRANTEFSTFASRTSVPSASGRGDRQVEALGRAAVVLADDDILRDVHETTGQVARVGRTESRVGQTLAGTVGRDEVLRHRQALAVRGDDRARDDLTLRVVHQTAHTGDVADLQPVTTGTGRHHAVDGVVLREVGAHRLGDLVGRLGPDLRSAPGDARASVVRPFSNSAWTLAACFS